MTNEHVWPLWLIDYANVRQEGVDWNGRRGMNPRTATLPLCRQCNQRLGAELEGPVRGIFHRMEAGYGISDREAELLIRWLWKFEGLTACFSNVANLNWRYSDRWTFIDRVLGDPIQGVRDRLTLAIGLTNQNDHDHEDWPIGIDSGVSELDGFFVSGVFRKTALMVSLFDFSEMIPACFGMYRLRAIGDAQAERCFFPPVCFPFSADAIQTTVEASGPLKASHEEFARVCGATQAIRAVRPRVDIPT